MKPVNNCIDIVDLDKPYDEKTLKKIQSSSLFVNQFKDKVWDDTIAYKSLFKSDITQLRKGAQKFDFDNYSIKDLNIKSLLQKRDEITKYFFSKGLKIHGQKDYFKAQQLYQIEIYIDELRFIESCSR